MLVLRTAFGLAMTKNGQRIPQRGGSLCLVTGPWNGCGSMVGVARARKMHRGKYRELTLWRQRGGSGRKASPLPTSHGKGDIPQWHQRTWPQVLRRRGIVVRFRSGKYWRRIGNAARLSGVIRPVRRGHAPQSRLRNSALLPRRQNSTPHSRRSAAETGKRGDRGSENHGKDDIHQCQQRT